MGGWMGTVKAVLRIAYNNQRVLKNTNIRLQVFDYYVIKLTKLCFYRGIKIGRELKCLCKIFSLCALTLETLMLDYFLIFIQFHFAFGNIFVCISNCCIFIVTVNF